MSNKSLSTILEERIKTILDDFESGFVRATKSLTWNQRYFLWRYCRRHGTETVLSSGLPVLVVIVAFAIAAASNPPRDSLYGIAADWFWSGWFSLWPVLGAAVASVLAWTALRARRYSRLAKYLQETGLGRPRPTRRRRPRRAR